MQLKENNSFSKSIAGLVLVFILAIFSYSLAVWAHSDIAMVLFVSSLFTVLMAGISIWSSKLTLDAQKETEEQDLLKNEYEQNSDLFSDLDDSLMLANRSKRLFDKFLIPAFSVISGVILIFVSVSLWKKWAVRVDIEIAKEPYQILACTAGMLVAYLLTGSYFMGASKEQGSRRLRPLASWSLYNSFLSVAFILVLLLESKYPTLDYTIGKVFLGLNIFLGFEFILNFIMELYRPRKKNDDRPLYESRLLALFTEPGGVAGNISHALDYQFGFKVSDSWFYRFCEKTVLPFILIQAAILYALTCIVVIDTGEGGIRETFGKVANKKTLKPGLYFKLPYPFANIKTFPVDRIQNIVVGHDDTDHENEDMAMPEDGEAVMATEDVVLWERKHGNNEINFIVGTEDVGTDEKHALGLIPVSFLTVSIPVHYKIKDFYKYYYTHESPEKEVLAAANKVVTEYLAGVDFFKFLGADRKQASLEILKRLNEDVLKLDLGIEVIFLSLQAVHPPVNVSKEFGNVSAALENSSAAITEAQALASEIRSLAQTQKNTLIKAAQSIREDKIRLSKSKSERFRQQMKIYAMAGKVYPLQAYLDVLEEKLKNIRKYIVTTENAKKVITINLEENIDPGIFE